MSLQIINDSLIRMVFVMGNMVSGAVAGLVGAAWAQSISIPMPGAIGVLAFVVGLALSTLIMIVLDSAVATSYDTAAHSTLHLHLGSSASSSIPAVAHHWRLPGDRAAGVARTRPWKLMEYWLSLTRVHQMTRHHLYTSLTVSPSVLCCVMRAQVRGVGGGPECYAEESARALQSDSGGGQADVSDGVSAGGGSEDGDVAAGSINEQLERGNGTIGEDWDQGRGLEAEEKGEG